MLFDKKATWVNHQIKQKHDILCGLYVKWNMVSQKKDEILTFTAAWIKLEIIYVK